MPHLYASDNALMDRLGFGRDDPRQSAILDILDGASRWVERETGHYFYPSTGTRYFTAKVSDSQLMAAARSGVPYWANQQRGSASEMVEIDECLSVSAVATDQDGDGTYETTWTSVTDYWLGPRNAAQKGRPYESLHRNPIAGRFLFPCFENAIAVTSAAWCYAEAAPADISELTLMAAEVLARPILDMTMAGVQTYKLGIELSVTMKSEDLPPAAQRIIELYKGDAVVFA